MKLVINKIAITALLLALIILSAACGAEETQQPLPSPSDLVISPGSDVLPDGEQTPTATPITTTAPEPDTEETPQPEPSTSQSTVPAGIVKNSGEIIGTGVAFREGPSVDSALIERLDQGIIVKILKTNIDAEWHKVEHNGTVGYIHRIYLVLDASLTGYSLDFIGTIINCQNDVNVRSKPSTDSEVIGVAAKGSSLTILPQDIYIEDWYQVEFEGEIAYIHANYVDVDVKVNDDQLSSLTVNGGNIYPVFTPGEYGYVVKAASSEVTISAEANAGVDVEIRSTFGNAKNTLTIPIPDEGMKTVRIALDGEILYSVYISRNVVTVGTWNIKRGGGDLLMQGRMVYDQQPDIMGIQEAYQKLNASNIIDNLASLRTRGMPYTFFSPTINYSSGAKYGNGLMSSYKFLSTETFKLDSGGYEKRLMQKVEVEIDGKRVSVYNTHLTYNTATVRVKQFAQIVDILNSDNNEYKILTGDFNADISEFSVFSDYTVVNTVDTKYYDYSRQIIDVNEIDNIIVTKNIDVINSRIVITKLSDHYPVFSYLVFK